MSTLFTTYRLANHELANRLVMAPMTRNRAGAGNAPGELNAAYYAQRATAGLIVTEGTQPSAMGQGYPGTPGLHTDEQVAGWALVADAVHAAGGTIFAQLMHAGRISHPSLLPADAQPVAPSAIAPAGQVFTLAGMQDFVVPRALETDELGGVIAEFVDAALRAVRAGLDGVELHAANGYLLQQFLSDSTNTRTDAYGGSPEARTKFVVEVARAVAAAIGGDRVGIRLSPGGSFNDIAETEVSETYLELLDAIEPLRLAYVHVVAREDDPFLADIRKHVTTTLILNTGFEGPSDVATAETLISDAGADLVSFGRPFISNPDLVQRLRAGVELTEPDADTFYAGGARGYTDYPAA